jgi:hypothetical protein
MKKLIAAGLMMFGSLYLGGCVEDPSAKAAPKDEFVVLTNAHVEHHGDSTTVTGLVNGAETTIVASEMLGAGGSSFVDPVDGGDACVLCLINTTTGQSACKPVECPRPPRQG